LARKWKPLPSPTWVKEDVFVPEHLRHATRNSKVKIVSLLSHGEGEAMVHTCHRKYEWGLERTQRQVLSCVLPYVSYHFSTKGNPRLWAIRGVYRCSLGQVLNVNNGGLDLSLPDGVLLHLFCSGLNVDADLCLDMTARGHFTHKPMTEQVKFLENFLESYTSLVMRTRTL
jgi:hypothetical protein